MDRTTPNATPRARIVIPARLESTRLPRKLLLRETGQTLLQHTYEAASSAVLPENVCVAADHLEMVAEVKRFGGQAIMTDPAAPNGTARVAEIAQHCNDIDIWVNVQGDEPEIPGQAIDQAIRLLQSHPTAAISTLATPIRSRRQLEDPACVKVVMNGEGRALYFSRSVIPHPRQWNDDLLQRQPPVFHQHVGLYAYRREFLLMLPDLPPSPLEQIEQLEQLRALAAGCEIRVGVIDEPTCGIDTAADYRAFVSRHRNRYHAFRRA